MIDHLQHIADLIEICRLKGIKQVVVSPGSRNAPLIRQFASTEIFTLHSIVDERSAGFYALGISLATKQPVILICTSGTAVLNYSPALAEAYYRHLPLIAITADRPVELIDQQDNQTIRQNNVFHNFIKQSLNLGIPLNTATELEQMHADINTIINSSLTGLKGPIHINVPVAEPLYAEIPSPSSISVSQNAGILNQDLPVDLVSHWRNSKKRMILCGQEQPNDGLKNILNNLANNQKAIILAEPISNVKGENILSPVDRVMMLVETKTMEEYQPEILISMGGPVVSKRLKHWLKKQPNLVHYRFAEMDDHINTYKNLKETVVGTPSKILEQLSELSMNSDDDFIANWNRIITESRNRHEQFIQNIPHSDLSVFRIIMKNIPENCILHFGNSSPVRYGQLFETVNGDEVYSNRGVSGIDGCLSTAAGFASQSNKINLVILGDLSFLYDSNALWNRNLPANLRIIVINNQGGGIFRMISGPSEQKGFEEFMEAYHPVDIEKLAAAYNISYFCCRDTVQLENTLCQFMNNEKGAAILEIFTPRLENAALFSNYFKYMSVL